MLTVTLLLLFVALLFVILEALGKAPIWPAVLILIIIHLIGAVPR